MPASAPSGPAPRPGPPASYAAAADLTLAGPPNGAPAAAGPPPAGLLWERAATAADTSADYALAVELAGRAREDHRQHGQARAAARARAIAGQALDRWGRLAEAREQLTAAVEVLRADPDTDTVRALNDLASVEVAAGSPDAGRLSAEALALGQALGVGDDELSRLLNIRGLYLAQTDRHTEAAAYYRESARLRRPGRRQHAAREQPWSTWRTSWRAPIPGRRPKPPGPGPGTCAGPATGAAWPLRPPTWLWRW